MGTSTKHKSKSKKKTRCVLDLSGEGPAIKIVKKKRRNRKVETFALRTDFKLIRSLSTENQLELDKLRHGLQGAIEKVVRVQNRFVKELNKHAVTCNRTKSIVKALGEIPFHADYQRRIVCEGITAILKSAEEEAKRLREEAAKKKLEDHDEYCFSCYACKHDNWP